MTELHTEQQNKVWTLVSKNSNKFGMNNLLLRFFSLRPLKDLNWFYLISLFCKVTGHLISEFPGNLVLLREKIYDISH